MAGVGKVRLHGLSPQTRHKPKRAEKDNGGFLQVTEDRNFVAKLAPKAKSFP